MKNGRTIVGWRAPSYCSDAEWIITETETEARAFASSGAPFAGGVIEIREPTPYNLQWGLESACGGTTAPEYIRRAIDVHAPMFALAAIPGTRLVWHGGQWVAPKGGPFDLAGAAS